MITGEMLHEAYLTVKYGNATTRHALDLPFSWDTLSQGRKDLYNAMAGIVRAQLAPPPHEHEVAIVERDVMKRERDGARKRRA